MARRRRRIYAHKLRRHVKRRRHKKGRRKKLLRRRVSFAGAWGRIGRAHRLTQKLHNRRDTKPTDDDYITVDSAWGKHTYKRTVLPAHMRGAIHFSWDDPRAKSNIDSDSFANYTGPKVYMIDGYLYTKAQALSHFTRSGTSDSSPVHARVLHAEPEFKDLIGPMYGGVWDGKPIMRYDTQETYDSLSI